MATTPYTASPAVMQSNGTVNMTQAEEDAAWNAAHPAAVQYTSPAAPAPAAPAAPVNQGIYIGEPSPVAPTSTQSLIVDPPFPDDAPPPPAPVPGAPATKQPLASATSTAPAAPQTLAASAAGGIPAIPQWDPNSPNGTGPTGWSAGTFYTPDGFENGTGIGPDGKPIPIAGYTYTNPIYYGNNPYAAANAAATAYGTADLSAQQQQQLALNNYDLSGQFLGNFQQNYAGQQWNLASQMANLGRYDTVANQLNGQVASGQANAYNLQNLYGGAWSGLGNNAGADRNVLYAQNAELQQAASGLNTNISQQARDALARANSYGAIAGTSQDQQLVDRGSTIQAYQQLQNLSAQFGGQAATGATGATGAGNANLALALQQMNAANAMGVQGLAYGQAGANGANLMGTQGLNYAYGQGANAQQMAQQGFNYGMNQGALAQQQGAQGLNLAQQYGAGANAMGAQGLNYALGQAGAAQGQAGIYGQGAQNALGQSGQSRADTQSALARMQQFIDAGPGASQAEALLKAQSDATMAQNVALAKSGRGAGDNVLAQRQAMFQNAAQQQKLGQDMASLRAGEAATWLNQKQQGLSAIQQGQAALRGQDISTAQQLAASQLGQGQLAQQYGQLGLGNQTALSAQQQAYLQAGLGNQAQMAGIAQQFGQTGLQAQSQMANLGKEYAALGQGTQLGAGQLAQQYGAMGLGNQTAMANTAQGYMGAGFGNQAQQNALAQQYTGMGQQNQSSLLGSVAQGMGNLRSQDLLALQNAAGQQLGQGQLSEAYTGQQVDSYARLAQLQQQGMLGLQGNELGASGQYAQLQQQAGNLNQQYAALAAQYGPQLASQYMASLQNTGTQNLQLLGSQLGAAQSYNQLAGAGLGAAQAQRSEGQQLSNNILNQQMASLMQQQGLDAQLVQQTKLANAQIASGMQVNNAQISAQQAIQSQQAEAANQAAALGAIGTVVGGIGGALIGGPGGAVLGATAGGAAGGALSDIRAKKDIEPMSFDQYLAGGDSGRDLGQPSPAVAPPPSPMAAPQSSLAMAMQPNRPAQAAQPPAYDFRPAQGYAYDYKDPNAPGAAPGRQFGPMAQDLEKTPAGAFAVGTDPGGGKYVDPGRLSLANAAGLGEQQRRLDSHAQTLAQMQSFLAKNRRAA